MPKLILCLREKSVGGAMRKKEIAPPPTLWGGCYGGSAIVIVRTFTVV